MLENNNKHKPVLGFNFEVFGHCFPFSSMQLTEEAEEMMWCILCTINMNICESFIDFFFLLIHLNMTSEFMFAHTFNTTVKRPTSEIKARHLNMFEEEEKKNQKLHKFK